MEQKKNVPELIIANADILVSLWKLTLIETFYEKTLRCSRMNYKQPEVARIKIFSKQFLLSISVIFV